MQGSLLLMLQCLGDPLALQAQSQAPTTSDAESVSDSQGASGERLAEPAATTPPEAAEGAAGGSPPASPLDPGPRGLGAAADPSDPPGDDSPGHALTRLVYHLERIDVRGNLTRPAVITAYVPVQPGDQLDPNDPALSLARFQLMGTGYFSDVRLSLERGSHRGWVVLVIEVEERNTLIIDRVVAGLSRVVQRSSDREDPPRPYAGLGIAERNLFGLGIGVSATSVASVDVGTGTLLQYGLDVRYDDRDFLGVTHDFNGRLFHNHAREFFGRDTDVFDSGSRCPPPNAAMEIEPCDPDVEGLRSVVIYDRTGLGLGTANDIVSRLRYNLDWLGERVVVLNKPASAITQRGRSGDNHEPIDFRIEDGASLVSSLRFGLTFDTRDHPAIPSRGSRLELQLRVSAGFLGSDYDFGRPEATYDHYVPLPWGHVLQLGMFAGAVFGRAPFFYHFYAADLSDLLPSRQLELNLDHRRAPNLLDTSIGEMDAEDLAARIYAEYQLPLRRSGGTMRGLEAYFRVGLLMLTRREDLRTAIPGYDGFSRVPIDLSFDVGVVADTDYGLFKVGFSSFVGFLPDLGRNP